MDIAEQVRVFKDFLEKYYHAELLEHIRTGKRFLAIDFSELSKFNPTISDEMLEQPEELIAAAEMAVKEFDTHESDQEKNKPFRIRISNLPGSQKMAVREIRSEHLNKFISIEGTIRRKTDIRPQVTSAKFECPSCGNILSVIQLDTKFREPTRCGCGRKGKFRLTHKDLIDAQYLVLEESIEDLEGADQPKKIDVFLKEDLLSKLSDDSNMVGKRIIINGMIKEIPKLLKTGGQSINFDLILIANHIQPVEESLDNLHITPEQKEEILKMSKDPDIFNKIKNSVAPFIEGHDDIKEALVLQAFEGITLEETKKDKATGKKKKVIYPKTIHVILVGDPGVAKSQLGNAIMRLIPRSRYASGQGASGVGLTACVVKDEHTGGFALEAGVIVLANKSLAVLDELDKMDPEDVANMHEAMAQQTITITKASIQATLKAETSILALANPKLSRFDDGPIGSQINFPSSLINRFDLIFIMRDIPDEDLDRKISSRVLNAFVDIESIQEEIDVKLLRAYIAYAKLNVVPKISKDIAELIQIKYLSIRLMNKGEGNASIPINTRQLHSLIKLAAASAKVRLSNDVAREDVERAANIMLNSLKKIGMDPETGKLDIDRISAETTFSQRSKISEIKEAIRAMDKERKLNHDQLTIPLEIVLAKVSEKIKNLNESEFEEAIEKLKRGGDIFEPRPGFVQWCPG
jgi:replicative DNA helicase Mcm